jgi:cytochrome P450
MARDARNYKDPDLFDPARFMGEAPELDPRAFFFGFGRRICAGKLTVIQNDM